MQNQNRSLQFSLSHNPISFFRRNFQFFLSDVHIFLSVLFEMTCTSSYYVLISLIPGFLWRFLWCLVSFFGGSCQLPYYLPCFHFTVCPFSFRHLKLLHIHIYRYAFLPSHFVFSLSSYYFLYSYSI